MTWVTPGKLLLRYSHDAWALVGGITAWRATGGATVPLDNEYLRSGRGMTPNRIIKSSWDSAVFSVVCKKPWWVIPSQKTNTPRTSR